MIGELTLWLMVIASDPTTQKRYEVEDKEIPITECETEDCVSDKCIEAQRPWIKKAVGVRRGEWVLSVRCQLEHSEGEPASLQETTPLPEVQQQDSGDETETEKR